MATEPSFRLSGIERVVPDVSELDELYREHLLRYLFARQFCVDRHVIDAGCGVGYGVDLISQVTQKPVLGIDRSVEAINYAQAHYSKSNAMFTVGDCEALPISAHTADVIVSFETIEHLHNAERFVEEISRSLKPDGVAIISTPNRLIYPPGNPYHTKEFDRAEFEDLLARRFSHVQIFVQDVVGTNRIVPSVNSPGDLTHPIDCMAYGFLTVVADPEFFIAVCSRNQVPAVDRAALLRTCSHMGGSLQHHVENLEEALSHTRRRCEDLEGRYDADTEELRVHASRLVDELANLRRHAANLEDAVANLRQWNADLVADQERRTKLLKTVRTADMVVDDSHPVDPK